MQGNYFNKIHFQAEERRAVSVQWGAVSGISVYRRALVSVQHAESPNPWLGVLTNNKLFLPSLGNWSIWYSSLFPIFKFHFSTIDKYTSSFYFSNKVCTHTHTENKMIFSDSICFYLLFRLENSQTLCNKKEEWFFAKVGNDIERSE